MESNNSLEQTLQDGKLYRHVNALIVAHLRDNNLNQVLFIQFFCFMQSFNLLKLFTFLVFLGKIAPILKLNRKNSNNLSKQCYVLACHCLESDFCPIRMQIVVNCCSPRFCSTSKRITREWNFRSSQKLNDLEKKQKDKIKFGEAKRIFLV